MDIIFYILIGAVAGLLAGLFGIGGGVIVVPLLASIFEHIGFPHSMVMHFAAGTSLAVMIITSSSSLRAHIKLGNDIWPTFKKLLPGLVFGTITGAILADQLHSHVLRIILGLLLLVVAVRAYFVTDIKEGDHIPSALLLSMWCFACGALAGMLGVGGGTLIMPVLMYYGVKMREGVAIATACSLVIAIVGSTSYMITGANEIHSMPWTTGYIYWPAFLGVALASPFFATYGARLSNRMPTLFLRRLFSYLILLAAIKLLVY